METPEQGSPSNLNTQIKGQFQFYFYWIRDIFYFQYPGYSEYQHECRRLICGLSYDGVPTAIIGGKTERTSEAVDAYNNSWYSQKLLWSYNHWKKSIETKILQSYSLRLEAEVKIEYISIRPNFNPMLVPIRNLKIRPLQTP